MGEAMTFDLKTMEVLFSRKVSLYRDLLSCLARERTALLRVDMDELWSVSMEKERLCSEIEEPGRKISDQGRNAQDGTGPPVRPAARIPSKKGVMSEEMNLEIDRLKEEIALIRKENMVLVDDGIRMLDELIAILAGEHAADVTYDRSSRMNRPTNSLIHREI
jgi:hypothetical protein